jgi:hypothetical protein
MDRRRENRTFCMPHDPFSCAATERIQETMMALRSHDDETSVVFVGSLQDLLFNVSVSVCPPPF